MKTCKNYSVRCT